MKNCSVFQTAAYKVLRQRKVMDNIIYCSLFDAVFLFSAASSVQISVAFNRDVKKRPGNPENQPPG